LSNINKHTTRNTQQLSTINYQLSTNTSQIYILFKIFSSREVTILLNLTPIADQDY